MTHIPVVGPGGPCGCCGCQDFFKLGRYGRWRCGRCEEAPEGVLWFPQPGELIPLEEVFAYERRTDPEWRRIRVEALEDSDTEQGRPEEASGEELGSRLHGQVHVVPPGAGVPLEDRGRPQARG